MTSDPSQHLPGFAPSAVRLDDLVDRESLVELCASFYALFRIQVRVFNSEGMILADARGAAPGAVCQYVNEFREGRASCERTVASARSVVPEAERDVTHPCFTGAAYRVFAIRFEGRAIGRVAMGPFLPASVQEVPPSLMAVDGAVDGHRALQLLGEMPRVRDETAEALARHLRAMLDLILFSGHRALLMSQMHIASVRESYRELTEKNRLLVQSYERLQELDRLKSNFLATVSHELRTPLTSIMGYGEMLAEGIAGPLNPAQADFVGTIREKGEQLLELITSILDLAMLEQGTLPARAETVPLGALAREVVNTFVPAARKRHVVLTVEVGEGVPPARGDRDRLRQVLNNLLDNALKFTPEGGSVTVRVRAIPALGEGAEVGLAVLAPLPRAVEVCVEDTGIGVPEGARERIFDAFFQVDSSSTREFGGTGLGLAIVRRIVEAHGGRVKVLPNEPQGSRFVVHLTAAGEG